MSSLTSVPANVIRLTELLAANEGLAPILDIEHPSIEVWVVEEGDELRQAVRGRFDEVLKPYRAGLITSALELVDRLIAVGQVAA